MVSWSKGAAAPDHSTQTLERKPQHQGAHPDLSLFPWSRSWNSFKSPHYAPREGTVLCLKSKRDREESQCIVLAVTLPSYSRMSTDCASTLLSTALFNRFTQQKDTRLSLSLWVFIFWRIPCYTKPALISVLSFLLYIYLVLNHLPMISEDILSSVQSVYLWKSISHSVEHFPLITKIIWCFPLIPEI